MNMEARHQLLSDLAAAHVAFKESVLHLVDAPGPVQAAGEWTVKDIVCHVSSWDDLITQDLRRIVRGHLPVLASFKTEDADDWNAFLMRGRRQFPPQQAITELEECYDDLVEELETVPASMFEAGSIVRQFIETTINHLDAHGSQVRAWREKLNE